MYLACSTWGTILKTVGPLEAGAWLVEVAGLGATLGMHAHLCLRLLPLLSVSITWTSSDHRLPSFHLTKDRAAPASQPSCRDGLRPSWNRELRAVIPPVGHFYQVFLSTVGFRIPAHAVKLQGSVNKIHLGSGGRASNQLTIISPREYGGPRNVDRETEEGEGGT